MVGKLLKSKDANWGYDAQANEYGDLISRGVIDPTKVVRTALQDASSVAGLLITTEAMVAEKPKKESPPTVSGTMGIGGDGGAGGDGGYVKVSISGNVATTGDASFGIHA